MKVIIAGCRDYANWSDFLNCMDTITYDITEVVSGGSNGGDLVGEEYVYTKNIPLKKFPADWKTHGKAAGPIRNRLMAEYGDALIAFWDYKSRGTQNMIQEMTKLNKPVKIFKVV